MSRFYTILVGTSPILPFILWIVRKAEVSGYPAFLEVIQPRGQAHRTWTPQKGPTP
jgi:hypothetical protein